MDKTKSAHLTVYSDEWRIKALRIGRKFVQGRGYRVYYPGSSTDISASVAFPESLVYYVDNDQAAVNALKARGYRAARADANHVIITKEMDIILIFNSGADPRHVSSFLRKDGCLFCNNYFGSAIQARLMEELTHAAALRREGDEVVIDEREEELWEYWQSITTDEEFIRHDATGRMRRMVDGFCRGDGGYVRNYRELYSRSIPASIQKELSMMLDPPEYGSHGYSPETYKGPVFADPKDEMSRLFKLPMKRGDADTVFIFRKV